MKSANELRDNQRVAFNDLIKRRFPEIISAGSKDISDTYNISCEMFPINLEDIKQDRGTEYYPVRMKCVLTNKVSKEAIEFNVDLLHMPAFQELGFKINGNYMQVLDAYEKMTGWLFAYQKRNTEQYPTITAKVSGKYGRSFEFSYDTKRKPLVTFKVKGTNEKNSIPVSVFFRALTGMSNYELMEMFGHSNPFVIAAFSSEDHLKDVSRSECIKITAEAILGKATSDSANSAKLRLDAIEGALYKKHNLNLGSYNHDRFENLQSFKHRAVGKLLAETVRIGGTVFEAGTVLTNEILEVLDAAPISSLKINHDGKVFDLKKFSSLTFRAYGMILAEDVLGLKSGTILGLDELAMLNGSELTKLKVKAKSSSGVETIMRRATADVLCIDDIFTGFSMWMDNLNGLDVFDKQYELTNRVCVPFGDIASDIISNNVAKVLSEIERSVANSEESLTHVVTNYNLNMNEFIDRVRDTKLSNGQMSEMCNIVAFTSKSSKISSKINANNANVEMISVQDTQEGRLDPYDSPESAKIGIVHHKTLLAETDEAGYITTPYLVVRNGEVVSDEPVMVSAVEATGKNIAMWNETFLNEDGSKKQKIRVLCDGDVKVVDVDKVHYKEFSNLQSMSLTHAMVTFPGHSNGKRITMSCNQQKQTVDTVNPERPLVGTGCESIVDFGVYLGKDILLNYYNSHVNENEVFKTMKDDIMNSTLTLFGIKEVGETRVFTFVVDAVALRNGEKGKLNDKTSLTVPYNMRNFEESSFSFKLNHVKNRRYSPEDVVAYNTGYSLKGSERVDLLDYGGLDIKDKDLNRGLALGKNLYCGYKTYESRSIDDAIVISDRLVFDETLTHKRFMLIEETCHSDENGTYIEKFGVKDVANSGYFDYRGLPKVGTKLLPGDKVISKLHKDSSSTNVKYTRLGSSMAGQVVKSYIANEKGEEVAKVVLVLRADIECGDKLAGRHGNKGVIAKIVPEEQMPYNPTLGRSLDIICNPLGVPSRQNLSQLIEVALGMCRLLDGKQSYVSAYHPDDLKFVKEQVEQFNVHPTELIDGRTGLPFKRKINTGVIYMNKLEHIAAGKIHAIGMDAPVDPVFLQPKKGKKNKGGQSFGEMENWCLHGVGAFNVLHDLYSFQSDDVVAREKYKATTAGYEGELPESIEGQNNNDVTFQAFIRLMGAEFVSNSGEDCYELVPLTDSRIRALSSSPVESKDNLHSTVLFGRSNSALDKNDAKRHWSYIELGTKIIHPQWVEKDQIFKYITLCKSSDSYSGLNSSMMYRIISGEIFVLIPNGMSGNDYSVYSAKEEKGFTCVDALSDEYKGYLRTGMEALVYMVEHCDTEEMEQKLKDKVDKAVEKAAGDPKALEKPSYLSLIKGYNMVKSFNDSGQSPSDYVTSTYPVLPQSFRPEIKMASTRHATSDFDHFYEQILTAARNVKADPSTVNVKMLYDRIKDLIGSSNQGKDSKFKGVMEYFVGKDDKGHGKIRSATQSKRVFCAGRAVISPARYEISPLQLGVPVEMLVVIYEVPLIAYFKKMLSSEEHIPNSVWSKLFLQLALNNQERFTKIYQKKKNNLASAFEMNAGTAFVKMKQWIMCFFGDKDIDGNAKEPQVVLAGRQPSLHKYSIRAFYPVPIWSKTIEINSLVCKGYNADFDGDQMWLTGMMSKEARDEAIEKLSPKVDFINPKNSSVMLEHTQDITLGCYCATMLKDNAEVCTQSISDAYYYNSITEIELDVFSGMIEPYDLVVFTFCPERDEVFRYVSTAGRILFNSIFEDGFTEEPFDNPLNLAGIDTSKFYKLKYDGVITSGKGGKEPLVYYNLQEICKQLYLDSDETASGCISAYYDIEKFGFKFSDLFGVSISIDDLDIENNKKQILEEVNAKRALIEQDQQNGLIAEEDAKDAILSLYTDKKFGANQKIQNTLVENISRNNNLFIMMDSGARGNLSQLMHMCGAIGVLEKTKVENMSDSVTSNYYEGLDTFDVHMASYSSRTGVASTQRETRDAGFSTRKVVYMTDGFKITASDCGKTDWWYDVVWDDRIDELSRFEPSSEWFDEKLRGNELISCDIEVPTENGVLGDEAFSLLQSEGFNQITIRDSKGEHSIVAEPDILLGSVVSSADTENKKKFAFLVDENEELTTDAIQAFDNYKVMNIATNYGNLECRYTMTKACRSELLYREAKEIKYLSARTNHTTGEIVNVITPETLDYIERDGVSRIQARVMLDCKAKNGVCAHCYGLKYSNLQLPEVGEVVGTEAAQAIGEPAAQLTMNVVNKGGAAGSSLSSGVQTFNAYLNGSVVGGSSAKVASIPEFSGYARISKMDDAATISIEPVDKENCEMCQKCLASAGGHCPLQDLNKSSDPLCMVPEKVPNEMLSVKNGEWVDSGYPVTKYPLVADGIHSVKDDKSVDVVLRRKQMIWIHNYYNIFHDSSIDINARHFEILVIVQNQHAIVTSSDNPQFAIGGVYKISDLMAAGDSVQYMMKTADNKDTILRNSGLIAALTFAEQAPVIARATMSDLKSDCATNNSPIGNISIGQEVGSSELKVLSNPVSDSLFGDISLEDDTETEEDYIQMIESAGFGGGDSSFDMDFFDDSILLDEPESVEEPVAQSDGLGAMDAFSSVEKEEPVEEAEELVEESNTVECTIRYFLNSELLTECTQVREISIGSPVVADVSVLPSGCILSPGTVDSLIAERGKTEYEFYYVTDFTEQDFDEFEDDFDFDDDVDFEASASTEDSEEKEDNPEIAGNSSGEVDSMNFF